MSEGLETVPAFWSETCKNIRAKISKNAYEQWFSGITPLKIEGDSIHLGVSDDIYAEWLMRNFSDVLADSLNETAGRKFSFVIVTGHIPDDSLSDEGELCLEDESDADIRLDRGTDAELRKPVVASAPNCLSRYTFRNFVVGEENRYAYSAALTAAQSPGVFNPLYIYGGTGMGKTHLIQSAANQVLASKPNALVRYTTCEGFLNAYLDSLRNKTHHEFRDYFRKVDLLLVDDVHFLGDKEGLQEEFFNTFNYLYNGSKQIILTSDKQPSEIPGLEARLVSRFESGVITQITQSSYETRLSILQQKQMSQDIKLDMQILSFIAARVCTSIRQLEGALLRLVAFSSAMGGVPITLANAEAILGDMLDKEAEARKVSIDAIQKTVADHYSLRVHDIIGSKRPKNIAEPRMIAMYLCRKFTEHSLSEIGAAFGGRNHATVIHAVTQVEKANEGDENMKRALSALKRKIQGR